MQQLYVNTEKSLIATLPRFTFEGKIVIIQGQEEARQAIRFLRTQRIVGIDTETRPSFRAGTSYQVALLQVSTLDICFLFRLNFMGFTQELADLFADINVLKVGLSLRDDFNALRARWEGIEPRNYVDLQTMATEMGIKDLSLQKLFANVLGGKISKKAQLTNWEADVLTPAQQTYAATDAYTCILLYQRLKTLRETRDYCLIEPPTPPAPSQEAEQPKEEKPKRQSRQAKQPATKRSKRTSTATRKKRTSKTKSNPSEPQ